MFFSQKKKYDELSREIANISSRLGVETEKNNMDEEMKQRVAYALNLCTVSVSQIIDYHDIYILEQEYDAILNNINIQKFVKDDALLAVIKQILDVITFFKIQEGDKNFIEKEYQYKLKNAIWSAVPNLSIIFTGGNPINMAIAAATQIGIGYMNYRRNKSQYLLEKEKEEWELQRSAIEQFNGLRRELFEASWHLSNRYNFDDKYRLTEKQINQYNLILLDADPLRRYERLDVISHYFNAFPPYWYYKGNAAKEIANLYREENTNIANEYKKKAMCAYDKFDKIYREDMELMREDVIASSCSLEHIVLLDAAKDKEKINRLLERSIRLAGDNLDVLQQCVFHYISFATDDYSYYDKTKDILRRLINENYNVSLNGQILSRIYCKHDKDKVSYNILIDRIGRENVIPWIDDDADAQKKYLENNYYNISQKFCTFIEGYYNKYEIKFNSLLPYDFSDPEIPNLIYRFENFDLRKTNVIETCADETKLFNFINSLSFIPKFIELSNELFDNLFESGLFVLLDVETNSWKAFFDNLAIDMNRIIDVLKELCNNIRNPQANHKELLERMLNLCEFYSYSDAFFSKIAEEFNKHLMYHIEDECPRIDAALDKLFIQNNIIIPNIEKDADYIENELLSSRFFKQSENKNDRRGNIDFPVFANSGIDKQGKIKICIGNKIKKLTKNSKRIYFMKDLNESGLINKFKRQIIKIENNGVPVMAESIIAIIDTTLTNDLGWGIWFCYDGIYLRKTMHTDYISYGAIKDCKIKRPSDVYSSIIFEKETGIKIEYDEHSINKDILTQIIDEIKNIINV